MKHIFAILFLISAYAVKAQPVPVKIRPMRDYYFVGQGIQLKNGVNCFVLTDRAMFDKFFGKSKRADTPSFSKELMLVLLMPESNRDSKLTFDKVDMKAGNFVEVYCGMDMNTGKLPYKSYPIATCCIPIFPGVKVLNFYNAKTLKLLQAVEPKLP